MINDLADLYDSHIKDLIQDYQSFLAEFDYDYLLIAAGEIKYAYLDDRDYPFAANPQFKALLPLNRHPQCYICLPRSGKPEVIYYQARDYWYPVAEEPQGYWLEHFELSLVRSAEEALKHFPADLARTVFLGELNARLATLRFAAVNPESLVSRLHWRRAYKSPYEIACLRKANHIAAAAHVAARDVFYKGGSEMDVHHAYLKVCEVREGDLSYSNIIGFNQHAAVLHNTEMQTVKLSKSKRKSFLIDAGADYRGYAADITRTYAYQEDAFADLLHAFDVMQQALITDIKTGEVYTGLHLRAHLRIAELLKQFGFVRMSPEAIVETGISAAFYPHGLGHFLGLQVHDVGGRQLGPQGGEAFPPAGHASLRTTRNLEVGMVFTIEPGLYFIDMLLQPLQGGAYAGALNWNKISAFREYGGIRIEDDVYLTEEGPQNLTREAFAQLQ